MQDERGGLLEAMEFEVGQGVRETNNPEQISIVRRKAEEELSPVERLNKQAQFTVHLSRSPILFSGDCFQENIMRLQPNTLLSCCSSKTWRVEHKIAIESQR